MEEKHESVVSGSVHRHHSSHHSRHRRKRYHYSRERQSYNRIETRFVLMWTLIAVVLMVLLIPLLANFAENV